MKPPRILLADDYPAMLEAISAVLAPHYEIVGTVADGRALVEAALRLKPDLIVVDITMPLLSGIEAAVRIKKSLPDMRLLFVTMHASSAYVKAALEVGGTGYVVKSTMREELLDAVQSVLNGRIYVSSSLSAEHPGQFQDPATMDPRTARILSHPARHAHIVYPYTDDRSLVSKVSYFASNGLKRSGAVILITTEAHRYAIKRYLKAAWKVDALEASGQLFFFDAAETMGRFMANDNPDPRLFEACLRPSIEHAQRNERTGLKREAWLFGEMVDLLWPVNSAAAELLEELGNKVIKEYSIKILCAYSVGGPGRGPLSEALIKAHTHVIA
jgi:DNA-binding NarL/FixJ family response regulator